MKTKKRTQRLSLLLILAVLFTVLFVNNGTACAAETVKEGVLGGYYTYSLNSETGELVFGCTEKPSAPTWETDRSVEKDLQSSALFRNYRIKKIVINGDLKPTSQFVSLMSYFTRIEEIDVEKSNRYFASEDGVLFNKDKTILYFYPARKVGEMYTIPSSVTAIGTESTVCPFDYVWNLRTIIIPENVIEIYDRSFSNTANGDGNGIREFRVAKENPNYKSVDGVLFSKDGKTLISYPSNRSYAEYVIPSGVDTIGARAFSSTRNLKHVTIPEGVEKIEYWAFYGMRNYDGDITIPASVVQIDRDAFAWLGTDYTPGNTVNFTRGTKLSKFPVEAFITGHGKINLNIPCDLEWMVNLENTTVSPIHDGEWEMIKEPTYSEPGEKERICVYCGKKEIEAIPIKSIKEELKQVTKNNFKARSLQVKLKNGKTAIKITWKNTSGIKFDGVEIFRSTKKNSGYGKKPICTTKAGKYYSRDVRKGVKYYYKVRGYVEIDGVKYYTDWSAKTYCTVK